MNNIRIVTDLWRKRPRLINNPVIHRELVDRLRNRASFFFLGLFLVVGYITFLLIWFEYLRSYTNPLRWERYSRELFMVLNFVLGSAIGLIVPLVSASSINLEYEQKTWELLSTTPLSLLSILAGKFVSSVFFIWILLLSLLPIYGICITMGGVSPQEVIVSVLLFTEIIVVIGLIGICCSIHWKRTIHSITAAYFFGFLYMLGISFCRVFFGELGLWKQDFGPEMALSPAVIAIVYFVNERLPNEVGNWVRLYPYHAHIYMNLAVVAFLTLLSAVWLSKKTKSESEQTKSKFSIRFWFPRLPILFKDKRWIFRDRQNPVYLKDLRELFGESYSRLLRSTLIYLALGFLVLLQFDMFGNDWDIGMAAYATLLTPLLVLPFAANSFRGERDRDTWDILSTSTLTTRKIVRGKFFAGFIQFNWKFWAFYGLLFVIGFFLSFSTYPITPSDQQWNQYLRAEKQREMLYVSVFLCYVSACFYLSMGMYFSTRIRKTVTAYAIPFTTTLMILIILPFFLLMMHEIFNIPVREKDCYPFMGIISPFYLILLQDELSRGIWISILLFQAIWMGAASYLFMGFVRKQVESEGK
ncbi:MAG: hypothetical protein C4527_18095 [Candidatus Omnitrophota bacterium]|nr:MAG: hypothetical protein C4527_18095 [Candidatus Omnitrophota bacterium]